jgi:hypothetical protein
MPRSGTRSTYRIKAGQRFPSVEEVDHLVERVGAGNAFGYSVRPVGVSCPGEWWGSGRVEAGALVMGRPLSGWFRLLGGTLLR